MRSDTAAKCVYSLEGPVKGSHCFFDGRRYALPCLYAAIVNAVNFLLSRASPKWHTCAFLQWGTWHSSLETLEVCCQSQQTRKLDLASWFAGIGGDSVLRADVNNAVQVRQEGVPPSFSFTFLPARRAICSYAHDSTIV